MKTHKIGQTVYFIETRAVKSAKITSICIVNDEFIMYGFDSLNWTSEFRINSMLKAEDVFASKGELLKSL